MARKSKSPSDMSLLINSNKGTLAYITEKTNSLNILNDIVRQTCPDLPQEVWHIANFNNKSVVIEVNSSVWSQRLQFERMKINQQLIEATQGKYSQIEIKVSPYRNKARVMPAQANVFSAPPTSNISVKTADELRSIAQKAPKGLKEKLEKLAQHANK
ncbi:DciA family protein [Pseudocolwellia sp. AS88]|jgi:hypothetical protein|uniref:DUF721 domain-containing protein n=1 Tax=Pseudocolwellia TaxID=2848177 RepID=UPI0026EFB530|nr:DciA family protein [Pseudocolwellia sp. AS88]MDO7084977.1 DciA family protein [Pseudocolwellia sp. AS88]